ncbi:MAG: ADP-ribosylglycohydrolase family protein, partial [Aureispira sp.]|nr:ADP-ribosylglycohydrolase family protein [Aureispira sp.]
MSDYNIVTNTLLGLALGDALGVPVEFVSRIYLKTNPIQNMTGFGTHNQPKGTWSDDSSLTFCLAESLSKAYDINHIAQLFVRWFQEAYWTPHDEVFDVGGATSKAIHKIIQGISPLKTGGTLERDNGNGALMRIIPLVFYLKDFEIADRFKIVQEVTSITHAHLRSVLCSFVYIEICVQILTGESKKDAYYEAVYEVNDFCKGKKDLEQESVHLERILNYLIEDIPQDKIYSSGYVVHSLEAAIWCWLKENSFSK